MISAGITRNTFDRILERAVKLEDNFFDEIAEILIVDSSHIANPAMGIRISFFSQRESKWAIDIRKNDFLGMVYLLFFDIHCRESVLSNYYKSSQWYQFKICVVLDSEYDDSIIFRSIILWNNSPIIAFAIVVDIEGFIVDTLVFLCDVVAFLLGLLLHLGVEGTAVPILDVFWDVGSDI